MSAFEWIGRIVIGLGVGVLALFLLAGTAGAIAACMLSARIDHEMEDDFDGERGLDKEAGK